MTTATTTPTRREVEIDRKLAELWTETSRIDQKLESNRISIAHALHIRGEYRGRSRTATFPPTRELLPKAQAALDGDTLMPWERTHLTETLQAREALVAARRAVRAQAEPLEAIYNEERWSRFFLVQNADGHIHSSMHCSTCHPTTVFSWLPDLSGLGEADAVAAHGALLCTVCFPTAPVEWTNLRELEAEAKAAEKAKTECSGSRTYDHDSSGTRYASPRAVCNHCHQTVSLTSTGKMRAHKTGA